MTRLEYALRDVKQRMTGCPLPECKACEANDRALEELVEAAKEEGQQCK